MKAVFTSPFSFLTVMANVRTLFFSSPPPFFLSPAPAALEDNEAGASLRAGFISLPPSPSLPSPRTMTDTQR